MRIKSTKKYNLLGSLVYSPCLFQIKTNLSDASTAWNNAVNITKMWMRCSQQAAFFRAKNAEVVQIKTNENNHLKRYIFHFYRR